MCVCCAACVMWMAGCACVWDQRRGSVVTSGLSICPSVSVHSFRLQPCHYKFHRVMRLNLWVNIPFFQIYDSLVLSAEVMCLSIFSRQDFIYHTCVIDKMHYSKSIRLKHASDRGSDRLWPGRARCQQAFLSSASQNLWKMCSDVAQ